ncbi:TatD family hydrolase [Rickettsia endosymbiont of Cardiosporidium cionae]|uniref:TatD family hydrolase n=1 Tax=Rickettsia endosymbiont of Cardiosporidium cionae TaxID=2777155 RepID=UPI001E5465E0|nr:TatD family hydrolase [Rickettsia endosymbiont of Cardiosporidium cionae]KAF8818429.1 YchF/TatD family DNA exonuclease [Rickettsia endosymbiont of Cardiosporidium cionae]
MNHLMFDIVDTHCHLDMLMQYFDLASVIERAECAGVKYIHTIATKLDNIQDIIKISRDYNNVYASVGVHPNELGIEAVLTDELLKIANGESKIISIGETGLDYCSVNANKKLQYDSFVQHIIASQSSALPLVIHTRSADKDTVEILTEHMKKKVFSGVVHCFTGSKNFAKSILDLGLYISISGIITFKNATDLREILQYIPTSRLFCETDAPYLSPEPMRDKINEPAHCRYVLECISQILDISLHDLAEQTTENFFHLFTRAKKI